MGLTPRIEINKSAGWATVFLPLFHVDSRVIRGRVEVAVPVKIDMTDPNKNCSNGSLEIGLAGAASS
jgi:hypothetical protein